MKKLLLSSCIVFLYCLAYGQNNSENGYIIDMNSDTIKGELLVYDNNSVYRQCTMVIGEAETTYTPNDIKGYGYYNGSQYSSALKDTFCYIIGQSKFSILKAYDQFYLQSKDGKVVKLSNEKKTVYNESVNSYVEEENNAWRQALKVAASDCPSVGKNIKSMQLFERPLAKFMEEYSKCTGQNAVYSNTDLPWVKTKIGFIAGGTHSFLDFKRLEKPLDFLANIYKNNTPFFGGVIEQTFPRTRNKWSLSHELVYSYDKYIDTVYIKNTFYNTYYANKIRHQTITYIIEGKYQFITGPLNHYFHLGFNYSHIFKSKISIKEGIYFTPEFSQFPAEPIFKEYNSYIKLLYFLGPNVSYSFTKNNGKYNYGLIARYSANNAIGNNISGNLHKFSLGTFLFLN